MRRDFSRRNSARLSKLFLLIIFASGAISCNDKDSTLFSLDSTLTGCAEQGNCVANPPLEIGATRPAQVLIPSDYNTSTRYPLIIVLHGFRVNGAVQSLYIGMTQRVDAKQYVLITPDGTENAIGTRFWNATPACCAAAAAEDDGSGADYTQIDDVAYIRSLIEEAAATYSIDSNRIGLFGHSNGGFMALRLACEASDLITSVVSLAGSTFMDASSCAPATLPVSVLAVHGDADDTILYDGFENPGQGYPSARETISRFAALAGCDDTNPVVGPMIDVDASIAGAETSILSHNACMPGVDVELWTIAGGPHIPLPWVPAAQDAFVDWLIEHPRN